MEDETDYKHLEIIHRLKLSDDNTWHWSRQKPGTVPLPDFIRMKADGGHRPRDPEVRRKLEIIAGSNGKLLAWLKLKELGLAAKYQEPG